MESSLRNTAMHFLNFAALAFSFAFSLSAVGRVQALTPAQWRAQSVYQVLTDRFARTDTSTTARCYTEEQTYCGGSWRGIVEKLDYIQGMGFTAVSRGALLRAHLVYVNGY